MMFYNKILDLLLARPWSVATCLRLLTLSADDKHTTGHQQKLRLSIRVFMTRGGAIVFGGVHVWKLNGLVSLALATWPP